MPQTDLSQYRRYLKLVDEAVDDALEGFPEDGHNNLQEYMEYVDEWRKELTEKVRVLAQQAYATHLIEKICLEHLDLFGWKPQLVVLKDECEELAEASLLVQLSIQTLRFGNKVGKVLREEDFQHAKPKLVYALIEESWDLRFMLTQLETLINDPMAYADVLATKLEQAHKRIDGGFTTKGVT